jgi:DNA-binding SARP family transcriptional activator
VEIRVLGTVEVRVGGQPLDAGPRQQRHVLAVLAAALGRPVSAEALIDRVWDEAPAGARRTLHVYITRLRRLLREHGGAEVLRRSGGYVLQASPDRVDVYRFDALVEQAGDLSVSIDERVGLLREALDLWRGQALADLPGEWALRTRQAWRQRYLDAVLAWAALETRRGKPDETVALLAELSAEFPLAEPLAAALVRALHAAGRSAEALEAYDRMRGRLVEALGVDPGPELQREHAAVLADRPAGTEPADGPVPAQLPLDVHGFAGRADKLAELDQLLTRVGDRRTPVVITAVSGTAGVGKTALAVHWAQRTRDRFPDGQLYVNLRGFDPDAHVMDPAEAVRGFLYALGVPGQQIPEDSRAQAELYRSLVAGRRMLVLLDNARDASQVRPLLPGTPTAFAVVTSRNQLSDLVETEAAHPLALDLLSTVEARELMVRRLGAAAVAADPEAVERLIVACARLPLALTIVVARALQTGPPLAVLAAELDAAGTRLNALDTDDPASQVRTVFSWSSRALSPAAARVFRLLGLHPGPDVTAAAAASLTALPIVEVQALLDELVRANMVVEHAPGRYTFHDLLRAYAASLAEQTDTAAQRREATHRLLDHYVHTGHAAARKLSPGRVAIPLDPIRPGVTPESLDDHDHALDWLAVEYAVLRHAVLHAAHEGFDAHAWRLAWAMAGLFSRSGRWIEWIATQDAALAAAERLGDPGAQAVGHLLLASAYTRLDRVDEIERHLNRAIELYGLAGDRIGQAHAYHDLAYLAKRRHRYADGLEQVRRAHEMFEAAGDVPGQAVTLDSVGWYLMKLGDNREAIGVLQRSRDLLHQLGNRLGEAASWNTLGSAHAGLDEHAEAVRCYQRAIGMFREAGERYEQAAALERLGESHLALDDPRGAADAWHGALEILTDLDHPNAEAVRTKLSELSRDA